MRLIDRYILHELWPLFVLAIVVATFILFVDKLLWLTSLILRNHLDLVTAGQMRARVHVRYSDRSDA